MLYLRSMYLHRHISLQPYNSFGIDVDAAQVLGIESAEEIEPAIAAQGLPELILGGGSNILFSRPVEGLLWQMAIPGVTITQGSSSDYLVEAGAGVNWHQLVLQCLDQGLGGLENLSLIPGSAGAAPIQNIGAYGVEFKDVAAFVKAYDFQERKFCHFLPEDCAFGYRDSLFKQQKGRYLITSIGLRLSTRSPLRLEYGDIRQVLADRRVEAPTYRDVSEAVIQIRRSKLPDPAELGNAGSFFKNPVIPQAQFDALSQHSFVPSYPAAEGFVKVPAGWLIEQCGFKGKRVGQTGSHQRQALVIVNYGGASGAEILHYAGSVIQGVQARFGIRLQPEVNIW